MAREVKVAILGDASSYERAAQNVIAATDRVEASVNGAAPAVRRSFDDTNDSVRKTGDEMDRTGSVFANFAGNAAQDLPGISGSFGALNVAAGQFAEYATEGGIAMRKMAAAIGPIAVATFAISKISAHFQEIARVKAFNADQAEAWADAMADGADSAEAMVEHFREAGQIEIGLKDIDADELTASIDRMGMSVEEFTRLSHLSEEEIRAWGQAQGDAGADTAAAAVVVAGATQAHRNLGDAEERAAINARVLGENTDEASRALDRAERSQDEYRERYEEIQEAIEDVMDAQRSLMGDRRNVERALLDVADAEAELAETWRDPEATAADRQRAMMDLEDAQERYGEAVRQRAEDEEIANGNVANATETAAKRQIAALKQLADSYAPGSPLRRDLDELIRLLELAASPREARIRLVVENPELADDFKPNPADRPPSGQGGSSNVPGVSGTTPVMLVQNFNGLTSEQAAAQAGRNAYWAIGP